MKVFFLLNSVGLVHLIVYISLITHQIFKVNGQVGIIKLYAGSGSLTGHIGNGAPATSIVLKSPIGIAFDLSDNLYITDTSNFYIRKVDKPTQISTIIAGTGVKGLIGEGGSPANFARLNSPGLLTLNPSNDLLLFSDTGCVRAEKFILSEMYVVSGSLQNTGYSGDGELATSALMNSPSGLWIDNLNNNLYVTDSSTNVVRKIDSSSVITTVAGTGSCGGIKLACEGVNALLVKLNTPNGIWGDSTAQYFLFVDSNNHAIRKVSLLSGLISTFAGTGGAGYTGDAGLAINAKFNKPFGIAGNAYGQVYISDTNNDVIRKIDIASGIISTIAGTGTRGENGVNKPAIIARLNAPQGLAVDSQQNLYIADTGNHRILRVEEATKVI